MTDDARSKAPSDLRPLGVDPSRWALSEETIAYFREIDRAMVRPGDPRLNTMIGPGGPAQGMEAPVAETEGLGAKPDSPTRRDAPPSLPPTGEGLPEEIVKAIDRVVIAAHNHARANNPIGPELYTFGKLRDSLDATILHRLSAAESERDAALARAERAEKTLAKLTRDPQKARNNDQTDAYPRAGEDLV